MSKAQCATDSAYCGDVTQYQADVDRDCGVVKKNRIATTPESPVKTDPVFPKKHQKHDRDSGQSSATKQPDEQGLPAGCGYFTKPAVESDSAHLHFHQAGSFVCYNKVMYECVENGGAKHWEKHAPCSIYEHNGEDSAAEKLEKSNLNNNINEGD
jgi:hypothetical protein